MLRKGLVLGAAFTGLVLGASAQAVVVVDQPRISGADAIDPLSDLSDNLDQNATNATPQATLEAIPAFGAVHDWGGHGNSGTGFLGANLTPTNILSYTDPNLPDVRFTTTVTGGTVNAGNANNAGTGGSAATSVENQGTSFGEWIRLGLATNDGNNALTYLIEFGDWDGATFTPGVNAVRAAAFTLGNNSSDVSATALFKDAGGAVLSTQQLQDLVGNLTGFNPTGSDGGFTAGAEEYFGFDAGTPQIASIELSMEMALSANHAFDDFGFTSVPEPASLGVMAMAGLLLRRRRGA